MTVVLKGDKLKSDDIPGDPGKMVGHAVCVEGKVILYNNKPEIVVTEPLEFKVLNAPVN